MIVNFDWIKFLLLVTTSGMLLVVTAPGMQLVDAVEELPIETFSGTVTPEENRTYIQHLFGLSKNYSVITWKYNITSRLYADKERNPIAYFRHVGQEAGYGTLARCFGRDFKNNFGLDPRLFHLSTFNKPAGLDRECTNSKDNTTVTCVGSLKLAIGFNRSFYTSVGFQCGDESLLDLNYTISVVPIAEDAVPCTDWSHTLDKLQVIYPGLYHWVQTCAVNYHQFSRWNMLGLAQYDYQNMFYLFNQVLQDKCYQHLFEFTCRSFFPECTVNSTVILSCKDTCNDFNQGCHNAFIGSDKHVGKGDITFNVSCTSLGKQGDPDAKPCYYEPVECSKDPPLHNHETVTHQNGSTATSVAQLKCNRVYAPSLTNGNLTCLYDGEWHRNGFTCDIMIPLVIAMAVVCAVIVMAITCCLVYKFRFEVKLLTFKYCPCFSCFCRCCRRHKKKTKKRHHAFIMYHHKLRDFVKSKIYKPLSENGYNICVDFENLLPSGSLPQFIGSAISNSHRIIIVLSQDLLSSYWGQHELDQALLQKLEDSSMRFLVILMQDKATLRDVPRWLKGHLRTNIYIDRKDPLFFLQLVNGMPRDPVLPSLSEGSQIFYGQDSTNQGADQQAPAAAGLIVNAFNDRSVNAAVDDDADSSAGDELDEELHHTISAFVNRSLSSDTQPLVS